MGKINVMRRYTAPSLMYTLTGDGATTYIDTGLVPNIDDEYTYKASLDVALTTGFWDSLYGMYYFAPELVFMRYQGSTGLFNVAMGDINKSIMPDWDLSVEHEYKLNKTGFYVDNVLKLEMGVTTLPETNSYNLYEFAMNEGVSGVLHYGPWKVSSRSITNNGTIYTLPLNEGSGNTISDSQANVLTIEGLAQWEIYTAPARYTVVAESNGNGTALVNGLPSLTANEGTILEFTYVAADGYEFDSWDSALPTTLTADGTYTATFVVSSGQFTVYATETGDGTALVNGATSITADAGTPLHWTAISVDGNLFNSWNVEPPTTLTASGTYNATFEEIVAPVGSIDITNPGNGLTPCACDGTDEATEFLAIAVYCNTNAVPMVIPTGSTVSLSKVQFNTLNSLTIYGFGTIKRIDNDPTVGDPYLLDIRFCDNLNIPILHTDGNVAGNEPSSRVDEDKHSLRIWLCDNVTIGCTYDTNTLGDAVYISEVNNYSHDTAYSYSATSSGRNGVSIIDGDGISFNNVLSYNIGVAGMPGGFDIEPNVNDVLNDVHVHNVDVACIATGFQISNNFKHHATTPATMNNIIIDYASVERTHAAGQASTFGGVIQGLAKNVADDRSYIKLDLIQNNVSDGPAILRCEGLDFEFNVDGNCDRGMLIVDTQDFEITGSINDVNESCIHFNTFDDAQSTESISNGVVNMTLKNPDTLGTSNDGVITIEGGSTTRVSDVTFSGDYAKDVTGDYGVTANTSSSMTFENLDISGFEPNTVTGTTPTITVGENVTGWPEA